ncbi:MAG: Rieske 2Fe-2S domain-containing protein [Rhizobiaceae bacterium]|nr:Rieske 2Fe-2S domain-containing protein [Rhizobiaceae bacterium]
MDAAAPRYWPEAQAGSIPYWIYTDKDNYLEELERVWYGPHWLYAGLEVEVPEPGSYKTTVLGARPVVISRAKDGTVHAFENRCAHRGVRICQERFGSVESFTCPYHQWNYALDGALQGVPFRRGIKGEGGMPRDFDPKANGLRKLKVECVNGAIWASFSHDMPSFREYVGETIWGRYSRVFSGKKLRIIGYNRQLVPSNWKLMLENVKDPYHAALLHVFFATFGLYRPDQKNALEMDESGAHACLTAIMPPKDAAPADGNAVATSLPGFDAGLQLADSRLIEGVRELTGTETVSVMSLFPSVILLQQLNSMQARQIVPRSVDKFELIYTHFGFEDDDEEMQARRVRHANLFGPAGFVSADDGEVLQMTQEGISPDAENASALVRMGGAEIKDATHMATESAIRGMYRYYREVMTA